MDITTGGTFTGPLKLDYTPGTSTEIGMFNTHSRISSCALWA